MTVRIITPKRHADGYLYHSCPVDGTEFQSYDPYNDLMLDPSEPFGESRLRCCGYCTVEFLDTKYRVTCSATTSAGELAVNLIESEPPKASSTYKGLTGDEIVDSPTLPHTWIEPKLDGVRVIVHILPDLGVFITTRRRSADGSFKRIEMNVPYLRNLVALNDVGRNGYTILDGELTMAPAVVDGVPRDCLSMTMGVVGALPDKAVALQARYGLATLNLFDISRYNDANIEHWQLRTRHAMLNTICMENKLTRVADIRLVPHAVTAEPESRKQFINACLTQGYEGAVLKNPNAAYRESKAWLKIKQHLTIDAQIVHWEEGTPGGKYEGTVGALAVAIIDSKTKELREIATVNPGDDTERLEWMCDYGAHIEPREPNSDGLFAPEIVAARIIVELEGQLITRDGRMRHPRIIRWRTDLSEPNEVTFNG